MAFPKNMIVTEIMTFETPFHKKEKHSVRARNFHSITYRASGSISVEWDGDYLRSRPECITFVPKGFGYDTEIYESGTMLTVHFSTNQEFDSLQPIVLQSGNPKAFENLFLKLHERYQPGREQDYTCMGTLYQILDRFERELRTQFEPMIPDRILRARRLIDHNFDQPVTVEMLAADACISQTYFRKEFRHYYGMSPIAYLKKVRIENAKIDLQSGYYTVSQVAARCGFDSISYFSYEFHRCTGFTPKEFQNSL